MGFQNLSLNASLILIGLSAGLFYAWSVSVIPGTQKLEHLTYLRTMQSINREILNPAFFLVFFGSLITLICSTYFTYMGNKEGFWVLLIATLLYFIGTIGVTGLGNVPLNNELEVLKLEELSIQKITDFRHYYEARWNTFHMLRMICATLSFIVMLVGLNIQLKH